MTQIDAAEAQARELVGALAASGWSADVVSEIVERILGAPNEDVAAAALCLPGGGTAARPHRRRDHRDLARPGWRVCAGRAIRLTAAGIDQRAADWPQLLLRRSQSDPSRMAYQTGQAMAESLLRRHLDEESEYPQSVGLSVWGTSAMRTSGDDIAEVLALLGVTPVWDDASRRVVGLEVVDLSELGRPRIDVTVRISGFFRDAFPHVLAMLDDAVRMVADLDEPSHLNFVRQHAQDDLAAHGDQRRATTRIFGSKPGSYGAGNAAADGSGNWRNDHDLAEVYSAWGGFAYGRDLDGMPAREDMEANYRRIAVAAKNVDTREHDIADSDDYFQYHGGMVATVRALTGAEPKAYVGDSTAPDAVRTRSLTEETAECSGHG